MDAYKEMTHSNQASKDDALFAGIEVYDGENPSCFEGWLDAVEQACNMTRQKFKKGVDEEVNWSHQGNAFMMNAFWTDNDIISKLRQDFSSMSTMNRAREELKDLKATTRSAYQFIHVQIWKDPLPCHRESSTQ